VRRGQREEQSNHGYLQYYGHLRIIQRGGE
jgi:hypothetical protein